MTLALPRRVLGRAVAIAAALVLAALALTHLPPHWLVDPARFERPGDGFVVTDRAGTPLRFVRSDAVDRSWTPLPAISPWVVRAFVAAEDQRFFTHGGVDGRAVVRAVLNDLRPGGRLSGASTLTQQLVKRVYGRRSRWEKPVEVLRAVALERTFDKSRILEEYLNRVPYAENVEGVGRASERYFGRSVETLGPAEAALLAAMPQAPSWNDPRRSPVRARARRDWILGRMEALGMLTAQARAAAQSQDLGVVEAPPRPWRAARFVDRVVVAVRAGSGGLRTADRTVRTTLSLPLQREVERLATAQVERFRARGTRDAVVLVLAQGTGDVLAYLGGGAGAGSLDAAGLDLATARRQPGSSLKPFVYALLFERGGAPATVLADVRDDAWRGAAGATFDARDYDGGERGPVRARVALASSLNLAALDAAQRVGAEALNERLRALGFSGVRDARTHGAAVVLGGVGVSPWELVQAYATLARGGVPPSPRMLADIAPGPAPRALLDPASVALVQDVLGDAAARRDGFGDDLRSLSHVPFTLKTGTSQRWVDAWAAVTTARFTVVAWLGDPRGTPMSEVSGFEAAAPLAVRVADAAEQLLGVDEVPARDAPPVRLETVEVCADSGLRPGPHCTHTLRERFAPGHVPGDTCAAHDDAGRTILDSRYQAWAARAHRTDVVIADTHREGSEPPVIVSPRDRARWVVARAADRVRVPLRVRRAVSVRWWVDGRALDGDVLDAGPGEHEIVAVDGHARRSRPVTVRVSIL